MKVDELKKMVRDVSDFPKEGIIFKDITPILKDKEAWNSVIDILAEKLKVINIDFIVGIEARGFVFGATLAYCLGVGFIPIRKKGKLPYKTGSVTYDLEYGQDSLEIHLDALEKGDNIVIVDDLLATGGTVKATRELIEEREANLICAVFFIELSFLKGRDKLEGLDIISILSYD